jgi:hypothetical protein
MRFTSSIKERQRSVRLVRKRCLIKVLVSSNKSREIPFPENELGVNEQEFTKSDETPSIWRIVSAIVSGFKLTRTHEIRSCKAAFLFVVSSAAVALKNDESIALLQDKSIDRFSARRGKQLSSKELVNCSGGAGAGESEICCMSGTSKKVNPVELVAVAAKGSKVSLGGSASEGSCATSEGITAKSESAILTNPG